MDVAFPGDTGHAILFFGDPLFVRIDCASPDFYSWLKVKEMGNTQMHVSMHREMGGKLVYQIIFFVSSF